MSTSSTAGPGPDPTPLPVGPNRPDEPPQLANPSSNDDDNDDNDDNDGKTKLLFDYPKLRLEILDLSHPGAARFLAAVNAATVLRKSVQTVLALLYASPASREFVPPGTRSVTVYLEDMGGVAYTKGSDLDSDHKEIRTFFSYLLFSFLFFFFSISSLSFRG